MAHKELKYDAAARLLVVLQLLVSHVFRSSVCFFEDLWVG